MALLEVRDLTKYFGGLAAVNNLDLDVNQGEILGLIGPNGAGKTTFFNLISGFQRLNRGKVLFNGRVINGLKPSKIAALGLVRTFQADTLFQSKTVLDNLLVAQHLQQKAGFVSLLANSSTAQKDKGKSLKRAMDILESWGLVEVKDKLAESLPHGLQRALGMAIALSTDPQLIMLDEPVTGMTPVEKEAMMNHIKNIREQGTTILLVEHDMRSVMNSCDRIVVISFGKKIAEGLPEEIKKNEDVIESYLGSE